MVELREEVVKHLLFHIAHGKLLLGILPDFGYPGATGMHIVLTNALYVSIGNLL